MRQFRVSYLYHDKDGKNIHDYQMVTGADKQDAITQVRNNLDKQSIEPLWLSAEYE